MTKEELRLLHKCSIHNESEIVKSQKCGCYHCCRIFDASEVVMIEEVESGKVTKRDVDLLNSHIAISHSNFEDLFLLSAMGATWYVLLFSRWIGSFILVWELRAEYYIKDKLFKKNN